MTEREREIQKKAIEIEARNTALRNSPRYSADINGDLKRPLSAIEIISESEIIYQWLIKDLK